jgi:hypothetical protein
MQWLTVRNESNMPMVDYLIRVGPSRVLRNEVSFGDSDSSRTSGRFVFSGLIAPNGPFQV